MTTSTQTLYTRPLPVGSSNLAFHLQAGDLVDNSGDLTPEWCVVDHVGAEHAEDTGNEDRKDDNYCDGDCFAVIYFDADECVYPLHVREGDDVDARFQVAAE